MGATRESAAGRALRDLRDAMEADELSTAFSGIDTVGMSIGILGEAVHQKLREMGDVGLIKIRDLPVIWLSPAGG